MAKSHTFKQQKCKPAETIWRGCVLLCLQCLSSALEGARSQTEAPVGFSDLFLVSGLDQTVHHLRQGHASPRPPSQVAICSSDGALAAHGADEIGANFPLTFTHLQ